MESNSVEKSSAVSSIGNHPTVEQLNAKYDDVEPIDQAELQMQAKWSVVDAVRPSTTRPSAEPTRQSRDSYSCNNMMEHN